MVLIRDNHIFQASQSNFAAWDHYLDWPANYEDTLSRAYHHRHICGHRVVEAAEVHEIYDAHWLFSEFTNGEVAPTLRDVLAVNDVDSRAVGQCRVPRRLELARPRCLPAPQWTSSELIGTPR